MALTLPTTEDLQEWSNEQIYHIPDNHKEQTFKDIFSIYSYAEQVLITYGNIRQFLQTKYQIQWQQTENHKIWEDLMIQLDRNLKKMIYQEEKIFLPSLEKINSALQKDIYCDILRIKYDDICECSDQSSSLDCIDQQPKQQQELQQKKRCNNRQKDCCTQLICQDQTCENNSPTMSFSESKNLYSTKYLKSLSTDIKLYIQNQKECQQLDHIEDQIGNIFVGETSNNNNSNNQQGLNCSSEIIVRDQKSNNSLSQQHRLHLNKDSDYTFEDYSCLLNKNDILIKFPCQDHLSSQEDSDYLKKKRKIDSFSYKNIPQQKHQEASSSFSLQGQSQLDFSYKLYQAEQEEITLLSNYEDQQCRYGNQSKVDGNNEEQITNFKQLLFSQVFSEYQKEEKVTYESVDSQIEEISDISEQLNIKIYIKKLKVIEYIQIDDYEYNQEQDRGIKITSNVLKVETFEYQSIPVQYSGLKVYTNFEMKLTKGSLKVVNSFITFCTLDTYYHNQINIESRLIVMNGYNKIQEDGWLLWKERNLLKEDQLALFQDLSKVDQDKYWYFFYKTEMTQQYLSQRVMQKNGLQSIIQSNLQSILNENELKTISNSEIYQETVLNNKYNAFLSELYEN